MLKMMTYLEANAILESSLSPYNYCICKKTALDNGADPDLINSIVPNAEYNRLLPPEAIGAQTITPTTYTIRFLDYDNTVLKTQSLQAGATPTPPSNPTRSGYTFSGWSPAVATVTLNQDYIATYTQNAPSVQYHIIFAEGKRYSTGFYFYMNNGTFVSISNTSNINSNDVQCIAYLSDNAANSFLIDKNESSASLAYTNDINQYDTYCYDVYTNRSSGYAAVQQYMLNSPVVSYCSTTFNGDGQVPSTSQLNEMLNNINLLNTALQFIGGTPFKTNDNIGSNSEDWYYQMTNKYWSREADYESEDNSYRYGMRWVGGYDEYNSRLVTDPLTHVTTTEWYTVARSYEEIATSFTITAFVRAIKPINVTAPETPTGTVNGTGIYYEYDVPAGTVPACPSEYSPQDEQNIKFLGWTPQLYAANKDLIYTAHFMDMSGMGSASSSGTFGFGTDSDGEIKGRFFGIVGEGVFNIGTITFSVSLTKYVNEVAVSTTSGTITLNNWANSPTPTVTISSSLSNAGLVDLGTTSTTGLIFAQIGCSGGQNGAPVGTHYVMDISSSESFSYDSTLYHNMEGNGNVRYYSRMYIPSSEWYWNN